MRKGVLVKPGKKVDLDDFPPDATLGFDDRDAAAAAVERDARRLVELGAKLAADRSRSVLVVLQGMDAAGKDGTVKHCIGPLNPMQIRVASFKAPTSTELAHDFLWRVSQALPERGQVGIFNRSHYEDVLVVRVDDLVPKKVWSRRYRAINDFERHLVDEGTAIVKLFLHISRDEQGERFEARIADRTKNWKFSAADLDKRKQWDQYMDAYRAMLEKTSTEWAPWYVVPGDRKWVRNAVVTEILADALDGLDLEWPALDPALRGLEVT